MPNSIGIHLSYRATDGSGKAGRSIGDNDLQFEADFFVVGRKFPSFWHSLIPPALTAD